ncbi:DsbA family oxidoreductase [Pararhodobacter oceanensis]|uniref:Polyketide biosynthesis protein n=1 Tax=Pararhodobacter oceanensis TaxID=2172121 RepID=A0A2T8HTL9_9RHOB|nr:DsbA family oxidoreductase [Pararhodobacter oceanensis]PVH28787.1 polyketide biosynthesis protein [Pararhodobacter oceanensis]
MSTKLDIFSDPICPWCYIGKSRLEAALEARPEHPFVIEWHPFMLNPSMPPEGMDRREYLEAKFGPPESVLKAYMPIQEAADADGLPLELSKISRTPATLDAHRLIHWAGLEGRQNAVVNALFRAYFTQGQDISEHMVLTEIAAKAGLDGAMVAQLLAGDNDKQDIRARDAEIRERGMQGVPGFIIGRKYVVSGAHPAEFWTQVIDDIAAASQ